jgi:hypothetical protein
MIRFMHPPPDPREGFPCIDWMDPRAGVDAVKKSRISYPCENSNPSLDYSVRCLVTISADSLAVTLGP